MPIHVVGLHCAHGDMLIDSLTHVTNILALSTEDSPVCVISDYNADLLPENSRDPYQDECNRMCCHRNRRAQLYSWLDALRLSLCEPECVLSWLPGFDPFTPITRAPQGEQRGLCALLDFAFSA